MTQQEYIVLYEKFCAGKCTAEEKELLDQYNHAFLSNEPWLPAMGKPDEVEARITNHVNKAINKPKPQIRRLLLRWVSAAIVLLGIGMALWHNLSLPKQHAPVYVAKAITKKHDIAPGGTKAILTLANGQSIVLDSAANGVISTQGNTRIVKLASGKIVYRPANAASVAITNNTVTTPRGGRYDLTLADGTRVYLNAASSITYPTKFSGANRKVSITGEAYFEVAKNPKMPFIVAANGTETQVLGTHFNIMAYHDEPFVKTTLVEGSVKFRGTHTEVLLKPGQQGVLPRLSDHIVVQNADMEETLAWKNGYFIFQDEEIRSIMRKVARWYDVEIVYEPNLKYLSYGGSVSQYKNISDLLKVLESTGTIHFKIEERRVTVMK